MAYEKLQSILEEAGLSIAQPQEIPSGATDGSNKVFTVGHTPLSDMNYDDVVDANDVQVLVDGTPVAVSSVDAQFGNITLVNAPGVGAEVSVTYRYSPVSMQFVSNLRDECEAWINRKMRNIDPACPYDNLDPMDGSVRMITRMWSAAMLLVRDYGFNSDTEQTSKDGYYKLKTANASMAEFMASGGVAGGDESGDTDESQLDQGFVVSTYKDRNGRDIFPSDFDDDKHRYDDFYPIRGYGDMH